jgi:hypothetical protein
MRRCDVSIASVAGRPDTAVSYQRCGGLARAMKNDAPAKKTEAVKTIPIKGNHVSTKSHIWRTPEGSRRMAVPPEDGYLY